ncbi:MAG: PAS domain S-box protein [Chloroflexi bacterium]|nr:PAS domain S-box protein [Chloroflexota bacterium]
MSHPRSAFPVSVALLYCIIGGVWIVSTDYAVHLLVQDPQVANGLQTAKGWFFVIASALVLYYVLHKETQTREHAEQEYRNIFENSPEGFFQSTPQGVFRSVNPSMAHIFGYESPQEMIALINDLSIQLHPNQENRRRFVEELLQHGSVENFEAQNLRKDGSTIWTLTNARVVRGMDGEILYYEGFLQDITQRKKAELALLESEWSFRGLYDNNPLMLFNMDRNGVILAVNQTTSQRLGYSSEELVGRRAIDFTHRHDRKSVLRIAIECIQKSNEIRQLEFRVITRANESLWVEGSARAFIDARGKINMFVVCEDIQERKYAESELIMAEERYRALVEQLPVAVYREAYGELNHHLYLSPRIETILGYTHEELIQQPGIWREAIHPEDRQAIELENQRTDETLEPYQMEYRAFKKDGSLIWLRDQAVVIFDENEKPQYWQGLLMDITAQKKAQELLTKSEESYRGLFNTVADAIYIQDVNGFFLDVNEGAVKMYGYSREELIGKSPLDVSAPGKNDLEEVGKKIELAFKGEAQQFEFWGQRRNGEIFPKNVRVARGTYFGKNVLIAFAEDITERKKVEEALRSAEARYRNLVEHLPAVVYIDSAEDTSTLYVSPQIQTLTGYTPAEWTADENLWVNSIHPEDREAVVQAERHMYETHEPFGREYRLIRRDGQVIWVYDQTAPLYSTDGKPLYYQGVFLDTTKQRQAEEAIRQSEERFSKVFESSSIAICITTLAEGRFIDANQAYWNLFGLTPENAIGHTAVELNIWKNEKGRRRLVRRLRESKSLRGVEGSFTTSRGIRRDTLIFYELINLDGQDCILSMFHDITEQKKAQDDLRRKEAILNAIAFAADQFLKSPYWTSAISAILEKMGNAAQASRVYIFQKLDDESAHSVVRQRYEWCAAGITSFQGDVSMQGFDMVENGLGRWVGLIESGRPVYGVVRDLPDGEKTEFVRQGILSIICMPIMIGQDWWGFIGLDDCVAERVWSESENEALHTAASIISAAIQREQSGEAEKKQLSELIMLHAVALASSTAANADELIQRITAIIHENLKADNCGILLVSKNGRLIEPHPSYIESAHSASNEPMQIEQGVVGKVALTGQPVRLDNVKHIFEYVAIAPDIQSELCVPITSGGQVVGVINIESKTASAFSETDERLINTVAGGLGTAIDKFKLFDTERRRARDAENLLEATASLNRSLDLAELFEVTFDMLARFTPFDSASIFILDGDSVKVAATKNLPPGLAAIGSLFPLSDKWRWIYTNRCPLILEDAQNDASFDKWEGSEYIHGWIGLPLVVKDQVIGFVHLDSSTPGAFTEEQSILLQTFVNQAAIAIENARLFEAEQQRRHEAETLREVATAVASTLDEETAIQVILEQLSKVVPFKSASVQILGDGYLEIVGGVGWPDPSAVKGLHFPVPGDNPNTVVIQEKRPYLLKNASSNFGPFHQPPHAHIHSWLGVPLIVRDHVIGMLAVDHSEKDFYTAEHAHLVETFAIQAAIAIENARLFAAEQNQRLREASMLDLMTLAASSLDLDVVNQNILSRIIKLIPCDSGTIQILKEDRLRISAAIGFETRVIKPGNTLLVDDFPLNARIITSKQPIRLDNVKNNDNYRWIPGISNICSFMGIPILFKGEIIGIVTLDSSLDARFTKEDEELGLAIATNAANAIGNARLFELEQQRRQEAENMRLAASAITSTLDARQVLETILIALQQVVPYHSATMFLLENETVKIAATQGLSDPEAALQRVFPADNRLFLAMNESNQPIILYDAQVDPRFEKWIAEDVRGWMGVPLITHGSIVGYITLDSDKTGNFDENAAELAQTFASQAAIAIDNARLYEETRRRLSELEVVSRVSFALRSTQDPNRMLPTLMKEILRSMETDAASIWLYNPRTYMLDRVIASGWQNEIDIKSLHPHESIVGHVYQTGEVHLIQDFPKDPYTHPVLADQKGEGWGGIAVPIRTTSQTIGAVIVAVPQPRKVEHHQAQLLITLAEIAGSAIHRAQLYDQSEEQVRRLTALRDVDTAIASSFDLHTTLSILLDHTLSQLNVDAATILTYNADMRTLNHIASLGFRRSSSIQASMRINNRLLNQALLERRDIFVENIAGEINHHRKELAVGENFVSYFATPLTSKGHVKGLLEVYLRQPFMPQSNWVDFFHTIAGQAAIAIDNSQLFENLQRTNQELALAYDTTLEGWGRALELRDKETQGHTLRVTELTVRLSRRLGIPETALIHIRRGVLLHDIGKMAVPDHILKKTGPLTLDEWAEMRQHPKYAYDLLYPIPYLRPALDIPYAHHEFWNGEGYPRGLKGENIPVAARIFAVVDVYDALLYDRPYREAWPKDKVSKYLLAESGTHFDPAIVSEFLRMLEEDE